MAKASQRSSKRTKSTARRKPHSGGGGAHIAETDMFFPRLRKQARWMFVLLALVFAIGFVGLGVGSGSSGIGDLFNGKFFGLGGSNGTGPSASAKKALKEIDLHPKQPKGYRDLATAYEAKSQTDLAIPPLEQYTKLRPKDQDALRELANLYLTQVTRYQTDVQNAQQGGISSGASQLFGPSPTSPLYKALGSDPLDAAVTARVNTAVQDASQKGALAQQQAIATYKRLVAAAPTDPTARFQLAQAAESIGDVPTAVAAYRAVIKLEPDASEVPAIKTHIKQLLAAQAGAPAASG